jgi:hypothetical protein
MAKAATVTKPSLSKPAVVKPALAKAAKKNNGAAQTATPKAPKPPKDIKPFELGEIVIFKGYTPDEKGNTPKNKLFTKDEELAVCEPSKDEDGTMLVPCVKVGQYHKYKTDPESVSGEEVLASELRRTNKSVPEPFSLTVVGDMDKILKSEDGDPLAVAQKLYSDASKAFFYFGGVLAKLYKEMDEDTEQPLFCGYTDDNGKNFENSKEGFTAFLDHNFGELGGLRKAQYYMTIYENFSVLENAADIVKELTQVGWWKAGMLAQYVTDDNASELVGIAQEQSAEKLAETLKTSYTTEGNTARGAPASRHMIKKTTFTFKLYEDAGVAIDMIMKAAGKQLGLQDMSEVFEHIVQEWGSEKLGEVANKAQAARTRAQNAFKKQGVKLPADHPAAKAQAQATA